MIQRDAIGGRQRDGTVTRVQRALTAVLVVTLGLLLPGRFEKSSTQEAAAEAEDGLVIGFTQTLDDFQSLVRWAEVGVPFNPHQLSQLGASVFLDDGDIRIEQPGLPGEQIVFGVAAAPDSVSLRALFQGTGSAMVGPVPGNASFYGCAELIAHYDSRRIEVVDVQCPSDAKAWTRRSAEQMSVVDIAGEYAENMSW